MSILQEIEAEVQQAANGMNIEMILMLLDRLEENHQRLLIKGKLNVEDALSHYVGLKIFQHHLQVACDNDTFYHYGNVEPEKSLDKYSARLVEVGVKVKVARRNYYVAKREYEGKHRTGCPCRGCRCIESFAGICSAETSRSTY